MLRRRGLMMRRRHLMFRRPQFSHAVHGPSMFRRPRAPPESRLHTQAKSTAGFSGSWLFTISGSQFNHIAIQHIRWQWKRAAVFQFSTAVSWQATFLTCMVHPPLSMLFNSCNFGAEAARASRLSSIPTENLKKHRIGIVRPSVWNCSAGFLR